VLQTALTAFLIGVLVATVITFAVMRLRQVLRTRSLNRSAQELGMRFSAEDPFDVPRRYADFALINKGHGPHADNVTYGRFKGRRVRAFDFRYELGHGTRRATRQYTVIVIETDASLGKLLMWNDEDAEFAPLSARSSDGRQGCWAYRGSAELARRVGRALEGVNETTISMQSCASVLMFFAPARRREQGQARRIERVIKVIDTIEAAADEQDSAGDE